MVESWSCLEGGELESRARSRNISRRQMGRERARNDSRKEKKLIEWFMREVRTNLYVSE